MRGEMFVSRGAFLCLISSYAFFLSISSAAGDFTVGLLIPLNVAAEIGGDLKTGKYYASAISIAVDKINEQADLLPGHNISFIWNDTDCDEVKTIQALIYQIYDAKVSAVIGPGCTCNTSARNAAAFNIPMISYMCSSPELSNKNLYSTFVRTRTQTTKIASSLLLLFREFEWNKAAILYENTSHWQNVKDDMTKHFGKRRIEVLFEEQLLSTQEYVARTEGTTALFTNVMRRVKRQARIVVFATTYFLATAFLAVAYKEELTNGEFVFVIFELEHEDILLNANTPGNWFSWPYSKQDPYFRCHFQEAFASVLVISLKIEGSQIRTGKFQDEVQRRSPDPPFYSEAYEGYIFNDPSFGPRNQTSPPRFAAFLYDAVYQYAVALNKTLANNEEPNGNNIVAKLVNKEYDSIIGQKVYIDKNGDAEVDLTLLQARWNYTKENCPANVSNSAVMVSVGEFIIDYDNQSNLQLTFQLNPDQKVTWPGGKVPRDSPECGFNGDKCDEPSDTVNEKEVAVIAGVSGIAGVLLLLFLANLLRQYRLEKELKSLLWKIEFNDLNFGQENNSLPSVAATDHELLNSQETPRSQWVKQETNEETNEESWLLLDSSKNVYGGFNYTRFGYFKGTPVVVKRVSVKSVDLTRAILVEMKQMLDVRHDNLAHFIGATIDPPNVCIVSEFYSRGSLQEILENMEVKLDHMFISSLVNDIVKGMAHIHSTDIKSHGSLKSSNCLVDSRWVLKIADYGLSTFRSRRNKANIPDDTHHKELLWTAPEILRMSNPPVNGTPKGDVYSFAIILQEFHTREGPYGADYMKPEDVIQRVRVAEFPPFRPTVVNLITRVEELRELMKHCWVENPEERPDFQDIKKAMQRILSNSGMKTNIFDNMVYMMEKYADNLEDLVSERTVQLEEEKRKTDALLDRILPRPVAEQLKRGKAVEAESFQEVSIYFSDIVGFTSFSSDSTPMQVVTFLNDLYTLFDDIISEFEVYKVETIGDAYMVVSGLPIRNGHNHAAEIAHMALHLIEAVKKSFKVRHRPDYETKLRVGIHSGPVVAGVVGNTMPRYCLFGDTVNTASRMESNGEALKIHISEATKSILEALGGFVIEERGEIYLKGKGTMKTYWLIDYLHKTLIRNRRSLKRNKGLSETPSRFLGISDTQPPSPLFGLSRSSSLRRTMKAISESPSANKKQLVETDAAGLPVSQTTV